MRRTAMLAVILCAGAAPAQTHLFRTSAMGGASRSLLAAPFEYPRSARAAVTSMRIPAAGSFTGESLAEEDDARATRRAATGIAPDSTRHAKIAWITPPRPAWPAGSSLLDLGLGRRVAGLEFGAGTDGLRSLGRLTLRR
ncbi:MAG: hypothetical protein AAFR38_00495 [Planctomycetota bacterium]